MHVGDDLRQNVGGVARRPAKIARVQVLVGGMNGDLEGRHSAQARGDAGGLRVPHVGVADERDVGPQIVRMGIEEARQGGAARFLLALEKDRYGDRQLAVSIKNCPARLDEGHDLTLVVGGAAGNDLPGPVIAGHDGRVERVLLPQVQRVDRLDVVMAVEQGAWSIRPVPLRHHHGVAGCRVGGDGKAKPRKFGVDVGGGVLHFGIIGRIG